MASEKLKAAARRNVKKAQAGAKRNGEAKTRKELNEEATRLGVEGRSKMGKDELRRAVARARR
jgi:hypothetical protein